MANTPICHRVTAYDLIRAHLDTLNGGPPNPLTSGCVYVVEPPRPPTGLKAPLSRVKNRAGGWDWMNN